MSAIQVLDKHVAELIAAGEVVERPASVVKELVENTIDAGATHVTVEIRDGGVTYIRIADDGCGMTREDVPVAFLRHATSKVRKEEDLTAIATLGFRGEALASVAAVARVQVTTCAKGEMVGTHYVIHGGEEILIEDAGCPVGTTFVVEDLFYNVPARMKFLKKDVSEGNAVAGVVERIALSHPEVSFRFIRDGRNELQTPGSGDRLACIRAVFGKPFAAGLIPVEYAMNGVKVSGFTCKPEACRQNRTMQHFFVNGRYVKTQTGMVALERAYKGVMMVGKFPTCVLDIAMPPETVDANIHPAKVEVRFINEKPVFDAVYYGVRSALESGDTIHRVTLGQEQTPSPVPETAPQPARPAPTRREAPVPSEKANAFTPGFSPVITPKPRDIAADEARRHSFLDLEVDDDRPPLMLHDDSARVDPNAIPAKPPLPVFAKQTPADVAAPAAPAAPVVAEAPRQTQTDAGQLAMEEEKPVVTVIGELFRTYILAQMGESLFIIDKHAAHERILYNEFKKGEHSDAQMLFAPVTVSVSREEHTALIENTEVLAQAGIELEDFGGSTVLVRTFPMMLSGENVEATVQEIAAGLTDGSRLVVSEKLDWIYHSSACRAATKAGDVSRPQELAELAQRVLCNDDIRYCPHGRPVCVEMTRRELEKQFGRIV